MVAADRMATTRAMHFNPILIRTSGARLTELHLNRREETKAATARRCLILAVPRGSPHIPRRGVTVKTLTARQTCATRTKRARRREKMADNDESSKGAARPETKVVHLGRDPFAHHGFVNPPVYRGSTVLYETLDALKSRKQPYTYGRRATPTTHALEEAITDLEGGATTILTSSGLGAVSTALLAFVSAGDHILITDSAYQPGRAFADRMLKRLGVEITYYDPHAGAGITELFRPNTRLVLVESPGSQTFEMQDIPAIAAAARARDIWVLADNTWATPLVCKPLALGVDVSIQAATKYIVGHADAMLGAVTGNARAARHLEHAKEALGTCPG
ncbi:MAG TPA: aminotransferase class V-fold PLP-dependent enzyme, partial [Thermomicrobiales bacterium]|nr:aminotransferase class V-fold PLP-dependent enzyme [Thermomicrobiales bacterium]